MFVLPARARLRALAVTVIAMLAIGPALVASPAEALFEQITNTAPPTVTSSNGSVPEVGGSVTASPGTWTPSGVAFSYQWLLDGAAIEGATSTSLSVSSAYLGKKLSVRVTGTKFLDTTGTATSAQTAAVENPTMRNKSLPTISGNLKIDSTIGANSGSWTPAGTYTYQWLSNGAVIEGATTQTFKLTVAEVGKKMSVRVTAAKTGYLPGTATSAQSVAVLPGVVTNTAPPTIYGLLKVGKTVGANTGSWAPSSVTWTYRWFADGTLIPGLTTKSFTVDASLAGKSLKVEVTGSREGYTSAVANSATSAPVTCSAVAPATLTKGGVSTSRIRVNWTKSFCATKYVVSYRLANVQTYTKVQVGDVSTFVLTGLLRARSYRIVVAAVGADGVQSASTPSILVKTAS